MALTSVYGYRPFTPPKPAGQADQNALYQMLAANSAAQTQPQPPLQTTPVLGVQPTDPSFGTPPGGGYYGTGTGSGDLPGPNVPGGPPNGNPTQSPAANGGSGPSGGNNGNGGGSGYNFALDFEGDPILARIRAANQMNIANAEASALAARKRSLIGYGYDPALAGLYPDATTGEAAKQNPFSTLAQLLFNHGMRGDQLTEGENKSNLFYSGERIKQTGLEGRQYTLEQAQAQGALQNLLDQISQSVLNAKLSAQQSEIQGESDAYDRAIQFALQYGGFGGAGGDGSGGGAGGGSSGYLGIPNATSAGNGQVIHVTGGNYGVLDTSGGWGVQQAGDGDYTPVKIHNASGHSDTVWVLVPGSGPSSQQATAPPAPPAAPPVVPPPPPPPAKPKPSKPSQ